MAEIGTGWIDVEFRSSKAVSQVDSMLGGFGSKFSSFGVAGGAAIGAGVAVGVGVALYKMGKGLEEAQHTLRQQTGATGKQMASLWKATEDVATSVPVSFNDAAAAVAKVNTRLGLTGHHAEVAAKTVEELSRVTGTDAASNVDALAKVLNRWNLSADKSTKITNELYRAHEKTGASVADLAENTSKGAIIMSHFGFGIGGTIATMGKLDRGGYSTSKMVMGLNAGLATMAKAGQKPSVEFPKLIKQIDAAHTQTAKINIAVAEFGKRAGPEMAAAIGQGVFSNDKLTKSIKSGHDTVDKANQATLTLGDYWTMFKNKVTVAVAPAAEAVVNALTDVAQFIYKDFGPAMKWIHDQIEENWPTAGKDIRNTLKSISNFIQQTVHVIKVIWNSWFGQEMLKIVKNELKATWVFIKAAFAVVRDEFNLIGDILHGRWSKIWGDIKQLVVDEFHLVIAYIKQVPIAQALLTLGSDAWDAAKHLGGRIKDGIVAGLKGIAGAVGGAAATAVNALIDVVNQFGIHIHKNFLGHGINIDWSPGLPHVSFAQGGIVTSPTLALVGETSRARPEIITPEHLMRQIVREEGGAGAYALTITNWETGQGVMHAIAGRAVGASADLADQRQRMRR